ncbi:Ectoine hydroxylase-related dioxygenase, phytanoyl-CoA dioxygenase (PhyH) family [Filimonas lacunae]|uniref:Ectoine hydroxylase-related dioxygenase, phytanoyl-CoA dioxygenase (PhyH) family n=1 Tax=Filimonas lacunae TaxID=477680 RepID=A0A1N7RGB3_9BACT|nr:phytanoyl-CoA dioxygenase family protein [Filimonas lacunae]SIT34186.1 Ectoine hydroxylase-related dioxygenase, phytanoyl-CoA dioxygenase (PhyH) family [Filimonas lacunae]
MKKIIQPVFQLENQLSNEQISFFRQYGFLHVKNFVDKQTVTDFLTEVNNVQSQLLASNTQKINGIPLKFGKDTDGSTIIQRLAFTSQYSSRLSHFLKDQRLKSLLQLLSPYEGRIGENEKDGLVVNHYINTENSQFSQMGWHTDSPRDLFLGSRILPMLNVGLHLDDCAAANGGLRVLAGTHEQSLFKLLFRKKYFIDNKADKNETSFDIEAGDLTIHDGRLWHRVQQSVLFGEASRRRVMYIPFVTGAYQVKHANSPTPFYHKLAQFKPGSLAARLTFAGFKPKKLSV